MLSTEGNMSPSQLSVEGLCASESLPEQLYSGLLGPSPSNEKTIPEEVAFVEVPSNRFVPCTQVLSELQSSVDSMSQCTDFGRRFYKRAVQVVGQHLQNGCSDCQLE